MTDFLQIFQRFIIHLFIERKIAEDCRETSLIISKRGLKELILNSNGYILLQVTKTYTKTRLSFSSTCFLEMRSKHGIHFQRTIHGPLKIGGSKFLLTYLNVSATPIYKHFLLVSSESKGIDKIDSVYTYIF